MWATGEVITSAFRYACRYSPDLVKKAEGGDAEAHSARLDGTREARVVDHDQHVTRAREARFVFATASSAWPHARTPASFSVGSRVGPR